MGERLKHSKAILWWIALITGLILAFTTIIRSISLNVDAQWILVGIYWAVLIVFIIIKQIVRRIDDQHDQRLGQIFVVMWWMILMIMITANFVLDFINTIAWRFIIPNELFAVFIGVLVSYGISEFFKHRHRFLAKKNNSNNNNNNKQAS